MFPICAFTFLGSDENKVVKILGLGRPQARSNQAMFKTVAQKHKQTNKQNSQSDFPMV